MRRCIDLLILTALVRAPERTGTGVTAVEIITGVERRRRRRRARPEAARPVGDATLGDRDRHHRGRGCRCLGTARGNGGACVHASQAGAGAAPVASAARAPASLAVVFAYSRDRGGTHPCHDLPGYARILQADAYAGFNDPYDPARKSGPIIAAACRPRGRRKLFVLADVAKAPLAVEAVRRIDAIFAVERNLNGLPAAQRLVARQIQVAPLVASLEARMRANAAGCGATPMWRRRWTTCSSVGPPSHASWPTGVSA